jgi:hypothetical protein
VDSWRRRKLMRDAIRVGTAKERAAIAIALIKARRTSGRAFSNCFEMGDGDDVVREIVRRAAKDAEIERRYPHVAVWSAPGYLKEVA